MPAVWAASSASAISHAQFQYLFQRQRPVLDQMCQRHPVQKLHGNEGLFVMLADLIDGADVGMVQRGSCPRLGGSVPGLAGLKQHRQALQSDKAAEFGVLSLVDDSLLVEHGGDRVHAQAGAKMLYFRRQTKAAEIKGNVEG
jgi:hypothetical protein